MGKVCALPSACLLLKSLKTNERNLLKFGGMIGHDPGRKQLFFGQDLDISVCRKKNWRWRRYALYRVPFLVSMINLIWVLKLRFNN